MFVRFGALAVLVLFVNVAFWLTLMAGALVLARWLVL